MKIVVIGGSGLIGTKLVSRLRRCGHDVVAASLDSGVNIITGEGLSRAVEGAEVLVDVANSPSFEARAALADLALELPLNSTTEVAGPEARPMDEMAREYLTVTQDKRQVIADAHARYFGSQIDDRSLTPSGSYRAGSLYFADWLRSLPQRKSA